MGLSVTAYSKAALIEDHLCADADECYEAGHVRGFANVGFEQSMRGLLVDRTFKFRSSDPVEFLGGYYYDTAGAERFDFGHSYTGYDEWRKWLCKTVLGIRPKKVWRRPRAFRDTPFFELIHFSDCEGTIGPEAAIDLADDFDEWWTEIENQASLAKPADKWLADQYIGSYRAWQQAFHMAAGNGLVRFS